MMADSNQSLLRILHYPPVEEAEPDAIRAAAHEADDGHVGIANVTRCVGHKETALPHDTGEKTGTFS